ncbi:Capsule assembly protein Wzi [Dyadobacter koreensis]|uniref:Capsule assembly protein Wzi n=1 Tax=Dyadobacter koreensis TaxID=408657 RepID=A0A1H6RL20_9BACT|nr:capsule assembly Wzi family protein [Dyadobacter koreensis]SEI51882.1 Capsule assembly protein Wzi [Dyadobacter koreensis]
MKLFSLSLAFLFTATLAIQSYSQPNTKFPIVYQDTTDSFIEVLGMASSTSRTPFWIQANQFGIVPRTSPTGTLNIQLENFWSLNSSDQKNKWRIGGGIQAVGNLTKESKLLLPQIHGTIRFKNWELFAGRKKQWIGLADSTLGTGSYIWSNNAMPIPKIQIGTVGFVSVPFTKGWISFNTFYSEGLFENNRPITSNLKLHQKAFYLRVGKISSRLKLYGGINHQVQWGGNSPYETINGKMPTGFGNYVNLIIGRSGDSNVGQENYFDNHNRVGNHLGTIDMGMEIESFSNSWFFYRQNIFEDGSLFALKSLADGLNGIRFRSKNFYGSSFSITEANIEFLYTKNQGGSEFIYGDLNAPRGSLGRDNYFNHTQVRDGWSYYDRTIGTPFIAPTTDTQWKWPKYADSFTSNNRVAVYHLGLRGTFLRKMVWTTKMSYSSNIGTYDQPFPSINQFSGLITMQGKINLFGGTILKGSVAADLGELYPDTYGFTLGLRKEGLLSR